MDKEEPQNPKKQLLTDPVQTKFRHYGKYSAMAFQMGITIALGTWSGIKIDECLGLKKFPAFTIFLSLFSVIASVYFVIKDLLKK